MQADLKILFIGNYNVSNTLMIDRLTKIESISVTGWITQGEEAINHYANHLHDVVFIDAYMEGMTGLEVARWMVDHSKHPKIVLLSEEINMAFINTSLEMGFCGYLSKSSTEFVLGQAIESLRSNKSWFDYPLAKFIFPDWLNYINRAKYCNLRIQETDTAFKNGGPE